METILACPSLSAGCLWAGFPLCLQKGSSRTKAHKEAKRSKEDQAHSQAALHVGWLSMGKPAVGLGTERGLRVGKISLWPFGLSAVDLDAGSRAPMRYREQKITNLRYSFSGNFSEWCKS